MISVPAVYFKIIHYNRKSLFYCLQLEEILILQK